LTKQDQIDLALEELNRLQPSEQLEAIKLLQERRIKKNYVRYFVPWSEQAEAVKKFTKDIKILGLLEGIEVERPSSELSFVLRGALGRNILKVSLPGSGSVICQSLRDLLMYGSSELIFRRSEMSSGTKSCDLANLTLHSC